MLPSMQQMFQDLVRHGVFQLENPYDRLMSKTYKDKPEKYKDKKDYRKPKDKRFVSSKGREKDNLRNMMKEYEPRS